MRNSVDINVNSLTDILIAAEKKRLSKPSEANSLSDIVTAKLEKAMFDSTMIYTPSQHVNEMYQPTKLDMSKVSAISGAMAMLILSAMSSQLMLETQMQGIESTMNHRIASRNKTMKQIKDKIKQSRIKTPFQRFMKWLNGTGFMKFMRSEVGKIFMFIFSMVMTVAAAALTIVSGGTAAPILVVMVASMAIQIAEFSTGKSMGELVASGMDDDNKAKLALQIGIDIALMVGEVVAGNAAARAGQMGIKASQAAIKAVDNINDIAIQTKKITETTTEMVATLENATKMLSEAAEKIGDVDDILTDTIKKVNDLVTEASQLATDALAKSNEALNMLKNGDNLDDVMKVIQESQKLTQAAVQKSQEAMKMMSDLSDTLTEFAGEFDDIANFLTNLNESMDKLSGFIDKIGDATSVLSKNIDDLDDLRQSIGKGTKAFSSTLKVAERVKKFSGLFDFVDKFIVNSRRIQNAISNAMQFYGVLYQLALDTERATMAKNAMEIDAIRTQADARDNFLKTIQETQMSDIQELVQQVKDAFGRAAQAIQEEGEAERAIARNITV
ncbi:MAG: hypothetical protein LBH49_03765 [Puniceicoccales bacterium]|jgi:ABC-type transporter Mla subunit MlaD|nr:hypothetical protein [Puniceicoccales bacterium]